MRALAFAIFALFVFGAARPAAAATAVLFESDGGDYIGAGKKQTFTAPQWQISVTGTTGSVHISIQGPTWWSLDFVNVDSKAFANGRYAGATRAPFKSPMAPGLEVSGDGRGCNTLTGWFGISDWQVDSTGKPIRFAINFKQNCEGGSAALYGAVRYNSDQPLSAPRFRSIAGVDFELIAGETALLDGSQSFDRRGGLSYAWQQVSGPSVTLTHADSQYATFTAPQVPAGGQTLGFNLVVTDLATGITDTDSVRVIVRAAGDPQTFVRFSGPSGDYITGGRKFDYNRTNSRMVFRRNFDNGVEVTIDGYTWWTLDFAAADARKFVPKTYWTAERFPFQSAGHPGEDISGDGRGCNTLSGKFDVLVAEFAPDGTPLRLAIDFRQSCETTMPALTGKLRYNAPL